MILGYEDIRKEILTGALQFDPPLQDDQIAQSSIDLPVGRDFQRWLTPHEIEQDPGIRAEHRTARFNIPENEIVQSINSLIKTFTKSAPVSDEGLFVLQPGDFVLVRVAQKVLLPNYLAARVEGRTRYARLSTFQFGS